MELRLPTTDQTPVAKIHDYSSNVKVAKLLSPEFKTTAIKKETVNLSKLNAKSVFDFQNRTTKLAFILHNVLTIEECQKLIEVSEAKGYEPALLNVGGGHEIPAPSVRNNTRTIIDDEEFVNVLWLRIQSLIPKSFNGYKAIGINERLRFLRYDPGEKFAQHCDGEFLRPGTEEVSKITLQIYLNDKCDGGATTFIGRHGKRLSVQPKTGSILVFEQHGVLHEGSKVTAGRKYTIRTEVMYLPE